MKNYRWIICALLFFATTINYIDRQILALIKPILDDQLGWTNEQYGNVNAAFQGAYAIGLLLFGWFIDRFGTKIGYAVSIAAWSVAAIGHAAVSTVAGFFTARVALGLGEGGNFPSAIKAVALWFPKKERALATSIFNSGTNVGAILAPALVPWIALTWGWHMAFVAAGVAGFLWLFLWFPFYNTPERIQGLSAEEHRHIHSDIDEKTDTTEKAGKGAFSGLLVFSGRIPRATFWGMTLALTVMSAIVFFVIVDLVRTLGAVGFQISLVIQLGWGVVVLWAVLALHAKRWHDLGKSGWMVLINGIPVIGTLVSLVWLGFTRGQTGSNAHGDEVADPGLLGRSQTWSFIVAKFMTDPVWWFFLIWLPDYFKKTRALNIGTSWKHLVTIYVIVTILSIFGGWVTGYLTKRGWTVTRARKTGMFVFALCVLPIFAATSVGDWTAVLLIGLAGAAHQAWMANLFTTVSDMFPKHLVASVIGLGGMAGAMGGMLFPKYSGRLLDHFAAQGSVTTGYAILFGICGCVYLVCFAIHHVLAPRFEPLKL
jgi:MFS family permease